MNFTVFLCSSVAAGGSKAEQGRLSLELGGGAIRGGGVTKNNLGTYIQGNIGCIREYIGWHFLWMWVFEGEWGGGGGCSWQGREIM